MVRVIIELYYGPDRQRIDLEVPAEISLDILCEMLVEALNLPSAEVSHSGWVLKDSHLDKIIYPPPADQHTIPTLLELGLLDGSTLILEPGNQIQPGAKP